MAAPARLQATAHEVIMTDLHMFVYGIIDSVCVCFAVLWKRG
jgi:hypothetical protein